MENTFSIYTDRLEYEPIDFEQYSFRLLRLFKGSKGLIHCELFHSRLYDPDYAIEYEALSYTWGCPAVEPTSIEINGKVTPVAANLHLAMQHLRSPVQDRILWIDALCIDQENDKERGHQVRQMGSIYERAERVIIWLGHSTPETTLIFRHMRLLEQAIIKKARNSHGVSDREWAQQSWPSIQEYIGNEHGELSPEQKKGVQSLLGRPWFKRVWVIQEVAKARAAQVMCSAETVSARMLAVIPHLVGVTPSSHSQAILDILPGPTRKQKHSWWSQRHDLFTLLCKFRASDATDSRDKSYALLGMASDLEEGDDTIILVPDYEKTEQDVVQATIAYLLHPCLAQELPRWTLQKFQRNLDSLTNDVLVWVIAHGYQNTVEESLRRDDVYVNYKSKEGQFPLAYAAETGNVAMVRLLLDKGAYINT